MTEPPESGDDRRLNQNDRDIVLRHVRGMATKACDLCLAICDYSRPLLCVSLCSASARAVVAVFHQASSASSCRREASAARAVSCGAGPPGVVRTLTKFLGLRMLASACSE